MSDVVPRQGRALDALLVIVTVALGFVYSAGLVPSGGFLETSSVLSDVSAGPRSLVGGLFDDWRSSRIAPLLVAYAAGVATPNASRRVIVYECTTGRWCGGLGDRTVGIVSTFMIALALDRDFFIRYETPGPLTSVYTPNAHNWSLTRLKSSEVGAAADRAPPLARPMQEKLSEWLRHDNLDEHFPRVVEPIPSNQRNWVPLMENPAMQARLLALKLESPLTYGEVAAAVLGFLFKPTPALSSAVSRILEAWGPRGDGRIVGIHLRLGSGIRESSARMSKARASITQYAQCAAQWALTQCPRGEPPCRVAAWVVFTDTEDARRVELFTGVPALPPSAIRFVNSTTCHFDQYLGPNMGKLACRDAATMLINVHAEWHALAEVGLSGGLVIGRSGFGETAALVHAATRRYKLEYDFDACMRGAPPTAELGQRIPDRPPYYDLADCAPDPSSCRRRALRRA